MHLTTRQISRGGLLVALALVLGISGLGEIRVPTPAQAITWMHVPVILAGIMLGPWMGALVGFVWGVQQFFHYQGIFPDPMVHIVPRVGVGLVAAGVFQGVYRLLHNHRARLTVAATAAAVAGTLTNTLGVLGMAVWRGFLTAPVAAGLAVLHAPLELLVAVLLTVPTVVALQQTLE